MPAPQTVGEMTLDELETFVHEIIKRETAERQIKQNLDGQRSLDDILDSIERNLIVLPENAKSSVDLLREDRER